MATPNSSLSLIIAALSFDSPSSNSACSKTVQIKALTIKKKKKQEKRKKENFYVVRALLFRNTQSLRIWHSFIA